VTQGDEGSPDKAPVHTYVQMPSTAPPLDPFAGVDSMALLMAMSKHIDEWPRCEQIAETCGSRLLADLGRGAKHLHHCAGDGMDPDHAHHRCSCGQGWSEVTT
jgi:hypothetical protein